MSTIFNLNHIIRLLVNLDFINDSPDDKIQFQRQVDFAIEAYKNTQSKCECCTFEHSKRAVVMTKLIMSLLKKVTRKNARDTYIRIIRLTDVEDEALTTDYLTAILIICSTIKIENMLKLMDEPHTCKDCPIFKRNILCYEGAMAIQSFREFMYDVHNLRFRTAV